MAKYIDARIRDQAPELTDWTVLLKDGPMESIDISGHEVGRTVRSYFPDDRKSSDVYAIRRLLSPSDEMADLEPGGAGQGASENDRDV